MSAVVHSDPGVEFRQLDAQNNLVSILGLTPPVFADASSAFKQLKYIEKYIRSHDVAVSNARSVVIESHYIDRDHIEDHSAFYSKTAFPYKNDCRRVHFFTLEAVEVQQEFKKLVENLTMPNADGNTASRLANAYLGFSVIKPLLGTPVGRTVLRPLSNGVSQGRFARFFGCTREYSVHLLGIELRVDGLAFQQQDVGVSACATTALWASLHKVHDHEQVSPATPAQITALACQYSLPIGRPMPSEGLTIDQMCQAVHALGLAPDLMSVKNQPEVARDIIHSVIRSGFAPVLILSYSAKRAHAICVVGEKLQTSPTAARRLLATLKDGRRINFGSDSDKLQSVYFHDDRFGPYLVGDIKTPNPTTEFSFDFPGADAGKETDNSTITHILVPIHPKIRLSFSSLHDIALRAMKHLLKRVAAADPTAVEWFVDHPLRVQTWIQKGHSYIRSLIDGTDMSQPSELVTSWAKRRVPRYCGIIRLGLGQTPVDLVVDCTSTKKNPHFIAVISPEDRIALKVANILASLADCDVIVTR